MLFDWDGTGNGETNIPDGTYTYLIAAHTNGLAFSSGFSSSMMASGISAISAETSTELYVADDTGNVVPLALYPPNFDTSGLTIFETTQSDIQSLRATPSLNTSARLSGYTSNGSSGSSGGAAPPSGQGTEAPERPPTAKNKGTVGTFLVGYNTFQTDSGTFSTGPIRTGWPYPVSPQYVALDGEPQSQASHGETWGSMLEHEQIADGFVKTMHDSGWKGSANPNITGSDVTSGAFNAVNVGFLCVHASYGTTAESDGVKRSYLRFMDNTSKSASYVKLDSCSFGGAGTNGLKWMAILGCNVLNDAAYNSLYQYGRLPINNDLHMLLSTASVETAAPRIGTLWAQQMLGHGTNAMQTVSDSWFNAGNMAYDNSSGQGETNHIIIQYRVAYWPDAINDHISDVNGSPGTGNSRDIQKKDQIVFSNP
jgi:hypothetical protein